MNEQFLNIVIVRNVLQLVYKIIQRPTTIIVHSASVQEQIILQILIFMNLWD